MSFSDPMPVPPGIEPYKSTDMARWMKTGSLIFLGLIFFSIYFVNKYLSPVFDEQNEIYSTKEAIGPLHKYSTQEQLSLDMNRTSYRPWKDGGSSSLCYKFETRFGIDLKRVWLLSYPGSGNTWVRYLIEAATGIFTGSSYNDKVLYRKGFLGESEALTTGTTLTQKDHSTALYGLRKIADTLFRHNRLSFDIPCVMIIRNPKRAIIAYWNYMARAGKDPHTAKAPMISFQTKEFREFARLGVLQWEQLIIDRLLWTKEPVHVIYYEDLIKNVTHELRDLLGFLGVPVDQERLDCISSHSKGSFKREGKDFDPFDEEEKKRMAVSVMLVRRLLKALGYPEPPFYEGL